MNSIISTWSPTEVVLPKIDSNIDYAAYFVTEGGKQKDLNITFNSGDWLLYIKKNNEGNWYKSSSFINFNTKAAVNNPDPGTYTRFRLDNNSNIIFADYIEEKDLPPHSHFLSDISDIENLKELVLTTVAESLSQRETDSVNLTYDKKTKTLIAEVNYDGVTIKKNAYGQLESYGDGSGNSEGGNCANHQHTYDQILGLEGYIVEKINENKVVAATDLPIDHSTIIINKYGQLSAVSTAIAAHKHTIDDIQDLDKNKADVWASDQPLKGESNVSYNTGIIDLSTFSIGTAIARLSDYIKQANDTAEKALSKVGKIIPTEPGTIEYSTVDFNYIDEKSVINIDTKEKVQAGKSAVLSINLLYPYDNGRLVAIIDDIEYESLALNKSITVNSKSSNNDDNYFVVDSITESYPNILTFQGVYKSANIKYFLPENIEPGIHNIYFKHEIDNAQHISNNLNINIYKEITPKLEILPLHTLDPNIYISGIHKYKGELAYRATVIIRNIISGKFIPIKILSSDISSRIVSYQDFNVVYGNITFDIEISINENDRQKNIIFSCYNFNGDITDKYVYHIPYILIDNTEFTESDYRVIPTDNESYIKNEPSYFVKYNSTTKLPIYSLVVHNNILDFDETNYTLGSYDSIGPDYSDNSVINGYRWAVFMFNSNKLKNNLFFDIEMIDGQLTKNKNGTLNDIQVFVGQSDNMQVNKWVNANDPYDGNSSINGYSWPGLDLFKSYDNRRYITFGKVPNIKAGFIFIKVGLKRGYKLNCNTLINSILESINEQ